MAVVMKTALFTDDIRHKDGHARRCSSSAVPKEDYHAMRRLISTGMSNTRQPAVSGFQVHERGQ